MTSVWQLGRGRTMLYGDNRGQSTSLTCFRHGLCKGICDCFPNSCIIANVILGWEGLVQSPDYLSQMANLVRENPSITVREIARELQFADNKSVYYWLEKHNFHGINEFKRVVLSDAGRFTEGLAVVQNGRQRYLVRVALFAWSPKEKTLWVNGVFFTTTLTRRGLLLCKLATRATVPG